MKAATHPNRDLAPRLAKSLHLTPKGTPGLMPSWVRISRGTGPFLEWDATVPPDEQTSGRFRFRASLHEGSKIVASAAAHGTSLSIGRDPRGAPSAGSLGAGMRWIYSKGRRHKVRSREGVHCRRSGMESGLRSSPITLGARR